MERNNSEKIKYERSLQKLNDLECRIEAHHKSLNGLTKMVEEVKTNITNNMKEMKAKNEKGITLDYRTFSEVINALSISTQEGIIDSTLFDKLIKIGHQQNPEQELKQQKEDKPKQPSATINFGNTKKPDVQSKDAMPKYNILSLSDIQKILSQHENMEEHMQSQEKKEDTCSELPESLMEVIQLICNNIKLFDNRY